MAQRYCTNCGAELPEDARFCASCGRPAHEVAAVATPDADVVVPPPPTQISEGAETGAGKVSAEQSTRNALIALGVAVLIIVLLVSLAAESPGGVVLSVVALGVVGYLAWARSGPSDTRLVLRTGSEHPLPESERTRILDEEIATYMRDGFFVRQRTAAAAQLTKPKVFSFVWALLWFLAFGVGIIVYLIYYAAKQDEGRYVEVDEYGTVKATRQVRHVL